MGEKKRLFTNIQLQFWVVLLRCAMALCCSELYGNHATTHTHAHSRANTCVCVYTQLQLYAFTHIIGCNRDSDFIFMLRSFYFLYSHRKVQSCDSCFPLPSVRARTPLRFLIAKQAKTNNNDNKKTNFHCKKERNSVFVSLDIEREK